MTQAAITGLGAALPSQRLDNEALGASFGVTDDWIRSRTGIVSRPIASPEETSVTLGTAAAFGAIADAGIPIDSIDMVICATVTPDHRFPAAACSIQASLGISAPAFDLNAGCSGFLFALAQADALVRAGTAHCVLVVGADVLSRLTDYTDRGTAILFGDGAGAVIVQSSRGAGHLGPFELFSDGSKPELLFVDPGTDLIHMRGREVYRAAVDAMSRSIAGVLDARRLDATDVDLVVTHQANQRILDAVAERVGVPPGRAYSNLAHRGNTSAASIPLALFEARSEGRLQAGDLVVLAAFGAGFSWGAGLVRWALSGVDPRLPAGEEVADA